MVKLYTGCKTVSSMHKEHEYKQLRLYDDGDIVEAWLFGGRVLHCTRSTGLVILDWDVKPARVKGLIRAAPLKIKLIREAAQQWKLKIRMEIDTPSTIDGVKYAEYAAYRVGQNSGGKRVVGVEADGLKRRITFFQRGIAVDEDIREIIGSGSYSGWLVWRAGRWTHRLKAMESTGDVVGRKRHSARPGGDEGVDSAV